MATHRSSGVYRGDSAALQYLLNELIPTSSIGMFVPKKEENKSELLDEAMKKYDKYDEKITKSREKQLDYAKKINKEQSTQWDYEQDEFFSQQRVLDYQKKIDKEDQKRLDYDAERSDALDEILERQSELLEMKSEYENKPIQFRTEEDALKLNRVNEELTKIDEFLGDRLPKEIEKTTDEATKSAEEVKNAFSDIGALLSQDDWVLERSSERYKILEREYAKELELAKKAGAEVDRAIYGNVNLDDRDVIEWSWDKLGKYKDAIESWGGTVEELAGSVSTVMGTSAEFDGVEIAFTPMLQTPTGPELLDADTVYKYIDTLISQMPGLLKIYLNLIQKVLKLKARR